MTTVLCTCNDVGIPGIAAGTKTTPVGCQDGNLVIAECGLGPFTKPIGAARLDILTFSALNTAPLPLTPGFNVPAADPTVARWALPSTNLTWTNDTGCQVGIAIGYDAGIVYEGNPQVSRYRFYIGAETSVNGGAAQIQATVQARTSRMNGGPAIINEDVFFSANPLGNVSNESLPFVTVPVGGTLVVSMFGYHTLEPSNANFPPVAASPSDAVNQITSTARVWAITGWV